MTRLEKMGVKVILGVCLWIAGTYALFMLFGEFFLIPVLAVLGGIALLAYIIKFHAAAKEERDERKTR